MAGDTGKASPGQPFRAPPAEIWNGMVDAGEAIRAGRFNVGPPNPTRPRETDIIKLKNSCGADRAKGDILWIDGKAVTDLTDESIWLVGKTPTADGYFAILKEPIVSTGVGRAQVSGCCLASVTVSDANHKRAKASAGAFVLVSADDGPIEIVYAPAGTGELECVVRFGGGDSALYGFTLTSAGFVTTKTATADIYPLASAAFGTVLVSGATIYDPAGWALGLDSGKSGLCIKQGGIYYAIQAGC